MNKHINSEAVSSIDSITWCAEWTARLLDAQPTSWPSGTCRVAFSVPFGNPLNDGTWTYTWEKGRRLKCMSKSGTTASFKYNENGLRIQKTVNGVVTNYTLHGKNIMHMTQGSNSLHFYYDASNKPAIVEYNGTKYAYVHNLQGDIVAILDCNGTAVVQYKYDAWGKPISKTGSMKDSLGKINPFRYRGYVYDEEMELYYLRSRYYTPVLCRFLNTDTRVGYLNIKDQNIFADCSNNCVAYGDDDGEDSEYKAVPDYRDWYFIIHDKHGKYIGDGKFMAHIHLYSPQHDEYAMNLDGTRHDKKRAKEIKPGTKAHKVLQHLKDKGIWPPKKS